MTEHDYENIAKLAAENEGLTWDTLPAQARVIRTTAARDLENPRVPAQTALEISTRKAMEQYAANDLAAATDPPQSNKKK